MRISVAMATYNGARYLEAQLESLREQTALPHELVVSDDGSTDATMEILDAFAAHAPFPVHVHRNERNLGYGDNFLKTASLCTGDWIAFCDQDDVWHPEKLATVRDAAVHPGCMLVVHSGALVDEHLQPSGMRMPDIRRDGMLGPLQNRVWWTPAGFTCVFDASLIHDIPWQHRPRDYNFPESPMKHDKWIYLLANALGSIFYISRTLVSYRRHESAVTGRYDRGGWAQALEGARRADSQHYGLLAEIADEYQSLFQHLAHAPNQPQKRDLLDRAATYYSQVAQWHYERAALYTAQSFVDSFGSLFNLVASSAYRGRVGRGLGYRALAKDIAYSLTFKLPAIKTAKDRAR